MFVLVDGMLVFDLMNNLIFKFGDVIPCCGNDTI